MHLTTHEIDRLLLFLSAELARKRLSRGNKLNYPEAYALLADEISEQARDGRNLADTINYGKNILSTDDVEPGVERLIKTILVEAMFNDGQKLVCIHDPIREGSRPRSSEKPGEVRFGQGYIEINKGKETKKIIVRNAGDRPVQVGSHYHFFEVNPALKFDRSRSFGYRLNIPAGTSIRFEPGDEREVELVVLGGKREVYGLGGLTQGDTNNSDIYKAALGRAKKLGYYENE